MVISKRLQTLDLLIATSEDHDERMAARRVRGDLLVQLALERPAAEDLAEDARARQAVLDAAQDELNRARNSRVQVITQEPYRGS